jgi:hypothetical protein
VQNLIRPCALEFCEKDKKGAKERKKEQGLVGVETKRKGENRNGRTEDCRVPVRTVRPIWVATATWTRKRKQKTRPANIDSLKKQRKKDRKKERREKISCAAGDKQKKMGDQHKTHQSKAPHARLPIQPRVWLHQAPTRTPCRRRGREGGEKRGAANLGRQDAQSPRRTELSKEKR